MKNPLRHMSPKVKNEIARSSFLRYDLKLLLWSTLADKKLRDVDWDDLVSKIMKLCKSKYNHEVRHPKQTTIQPVVPSHLSRKKAFPIMLEFVKENEKRKEMRHA